MARCDCCDKQLSWGESERFLGLLLCTECSRKLNELKDSPIEQVRMLKGGRGAKTDSFTFKSAIIQLESQCSKEELQAMEDEEKDSIIEDVENEEKLLGMFRTKMSTTDSVPGFTVTGSLGIVAGEAAIGSGIITSKFANVSNTLGMGSKSAAKKFTRVREKADVKMIESAKQLGADGIIGISYVFIQYSGEMQGLLVSGTAVKLNKNPEDGIKA